LGTELCRTRQQKFHRTPISSYVSDKIGLSGVETKTVMLDYQDHVPQTGHDDYTPKEAIATVRSICKRSK
jgi:hypothetical protein